MNDLTLHPLGTPKKRPESDCRALVPAEGPVVLDTFGGRIHVEWDPDGAITALGQLPFFTEYLKVSGLFEPWVEECPVQWRSPNAPNKRDVLGTAVLSVLCGHQRYAHISALRGDSINAPLLGMEKVVSEDSVRATFSKVEEAAGIAWLQRHLLAVSEPLLGEPWILDTDVTVKPIYGHQEGALLGYNPHKPGRPSHTYHTYFIANLRLVLDVASPICAWYWTSKCSPATNITPSTVPPACGSCSRRSGALAGRRSSVAIATGARRRTHTRGGQFSLCRTGDTASGLATASCARECYDARTDPFTPHIRTAQASLAIENNTLSIEQATAVLEGKRVLGPPREVREVRNALTAADALTGWPRPPSTTCSSPITP